MKRNRSPLAPADLRIVQQLERCTQPLREPADLRPLIDRIADAKIVMLGEATHGTHEFYEWRRIISEWLIVKHGFDFIAVEGDWPPCWEANRYLRERRGENAREVLGHFNRWPTWMWANSEVVRLLEWMRTHNSMMQSRPIEFLGLDVYSLFESIDAVLESLEKINPFLARSARTRYSCFDSAGRDERFYARSLLRFPEGCEREVQETLRDLLSRRLEDLADLDAVFDVQQNARIIANAENYYRTMMHGTEDSWNVRDRHMMETLELLLARRGPDAKGIVWAHNTHIGDYRATDMLQAGQVNIGGLARERLGENRVALVGFGTHRGSVIASHAWDGPIQRLTVPEARSGTTEALFHSISESRGEQASITLLGPETRTGPIAEVRGHRAIGVVYDPAHERFGNYVPTSLSHRYDAFVYIDETQAVDPFIQDFDRQDIPETWPAGQ